VPYIPYRDIPYSILGYSV